MRSVRTTAVAAAALGLAVAMLPMLPSAAGAAARDPRPAPGRVTGTPVPSSAPTTPSPHGALLAPGQRRTGTPVETVRLVVEAESRAALPQARRSASLYGRPEAAGLARLGYLVVEVPAGRARAAAAALAAEPGVASVRPASARSLHLTPNDPLFAGQQQTMMTAMQAPTAWSTATGEDATIAVLDGGFDVTHPDLAAKIDATWDAAEGDTGVDDAPGASVPGHGTATASVAAAATGNSEGIAGAAPDARLMLVKVADDADLLDGAYSAAGIVWAADHGADVISMSYGGPDADQVEKDAVAYARARGVVVVASAGNDPADGYNYPAAFPGVIAVGATTNDGSTQTSWSTDGSWIEVAAPGENVPVAVPPAYDTDGTVDGYAVKAGTSFSAPLVAGMAAVLRSYRPGAPATTIESKIVGTTKAIGNPTGNGSFAHGLVQFASALAALPAPTVITAPTADATVSGAVAVSATSGSPRVRFAYQGTDVSVTADVVDGVASTTLPTFGLDAGAATITAVSCDATSCAASGGSVAVVIGANDAPVITAPVEGSAVGVLLTATADAPAGAAVRFLVDGTPIGTVAAPPFTLTYDTVGLADGPHSIVALLCNSAATSVCETDNPSASVGFTVLRLRPAVKVSVTPFSPNGDGRRDTTSGTYTLDQSSTAYLRVYNGNGTLVRGPILLGTKATGTYAWSWDGRSASGTVQPDGTYTVQVSTSGTKSGQPVVGVARASVRIDRTRPSLTSVSASPSSVYPAVDGYRDTTSLGGTTKETVNSVTVTVYSSTGAKVRTLTSSGSRAAGRVALTWNGRTASGTILAAGTYRFTVLVQDLAGNRTLSAKASVVVSGKKLVKKYGTKTIAPQLFFDGGYFDELCSTIYYDVWYGYPYSHGYFSRDSDKGGCTDGSDDYVIGAYHYTLPAAVKYGTVRLSAYAGPHYYASGEIGFAQLVTAGDTYGEGWTLGEYDGTYAGPAVSPTTYLKSGRTLRWVAGTAYGYSYDVRNFVVSWSYYVLQ